MTRNVLTPILGAAAFVLALSEPVFAQGSAPTLTGFSPRASEEQMRLEQRVIGIPTPVSAEAHAKAMSTSPHVAGTDGQAKTRDYVIDAMKRMGLETEVGEYSVWLPHATSVRAWIYGNDTAEIDVQEPPIQGDEYTFLPQYPPANGYSAAGDVQGELVFVNFGLIEDYAVLDSMGVSVAGKVVLARYGRSFRGIKAREAEKRGAVGLFIYTDPLDDGFARGDVYPEGRMRPMTGIQRGSVFNGQGDPTTPGYASTKDAPRVPLEQTGVPRIPVVPLSARNAEILMRDLRGSDIPAGWQGGLPLRYHVGPGPVRVRMEVKTDAETNGFKPIWNTYGVIRGSEFPDEYVYIGSHRDGWGAGAADNISGTVSVLEAARSIAELVKEGHRPKRSIVFATWDAEEWGLIGSTEFVEDDSLKLLRGAVAYLNQDVAAQGPSFGAGGSPSLRSTVRSVVRQVPDPRGRGMIYDVWRAGTGTTNPDREPNMGDPGGGSDFAGFYNHWGIPHADWGFSGPSGVYHSAYDTYEWMRTWGDPGYLFHATAGRIAAAMTLRLANAEIHPYDYSEFARTMKQYVPIVVRGLERAGWDTTLALPLSVAITKMEEEANSFATVRDAQLSRQLSKSVLETVNKNLREVERTLTRKEGLEGRPWFRSLIYAADIDNGYATMSFPGVNEAVRNEDSQRAAREIVDLAAAFDRASAALAAARAALAQ